MTFTPPWRPSNPARRALIIWTSSLVSLTADQGSAHPKACVWYNDHLHIAKFPEQDDACDDPKVEGSCLTLARLAGIEVPAHETIRARHRAQLTSPLLITSMWAAIPTGTRSMGNRTEQGRPRSGLRYYG